MSTVETRTRQVALFGRLADELTRESLRRGEFHAALQNSPRRAVTKDDGHFVFVNLAASPPSYQLELGGPQYQSRSLTVSAPASGATPITQDGEDELQVIVTDIVGNRVSFQSIPLLPTIPAGATVVGETGFSTTLDETAEGVDVDGAELASVAGLSAGEALRILRSTRLLLRPGPYYPFPPGATVVAVRVVEAMAGEAAVPRARLMITEVNGNALTSVLVDGVMLFREDLPLPGPPYPLMIGTEAARATFTNERGDGVFHFPHNTPITSLTLSISKTGYVTQTRTLTVTAGARVSDRVPLVRS